MKYLLRLSLAFSLVVGIIALIALFLPRRYSVERSITIAAPVAEVFPLVADLARWREWNVWLSRDPAIRLETAKTTTGAGAWISWRSERQEGGRIETTKTAAPELMQYRMAVEGVPVESVGTIKVVGATGGTQTVVIWTHGGDLGYRPSTRWFGLVLGPLLAPDLERSLAALKTRSESGMK
jgi:uncharacterized protein YndB with AHSA1/START domain